jgi:hypothetical protein
MEGEVMPTGFVPRKRGRKPSYDLADILDGIKQHPGRWVKYSLTEKEAKSAQRQLARMDFDIALETGQDGSMDLYVRGGSASS